MKPLKNSSFQYQSGATLIEVLVAVLIFSFGLLGLVGLQSRATQFSGDAEDRHRATSLAAEISAEMYVAQTVNLPSATVTAWTNKVQAAASAGLPGASAAITVTPATAAKPAMANISITWKAPNTPISTYSTDVFNVRAASAPPAIP